MMNTHWLVICSCGWLGTWVRVGMGREVGKSAAWWGDRLFTVLPSAKSPSSAIRSRTRLTCHSRNSRRALSAQPAASSSWYPASWAG